MSLEFLTQIYVFVLAVFVGFEVVSKVPVVLHTPLMSGTNAIHGIIVIGGIVVMGSSHGALEQVLGFVVTDRMLEMFRNKPKPGGK